MNMRVVLEGTTPGMKDAKEAGKIAPDMFFIRDELLYGLRGGLEEGRISRALMTTNEPTETFGHRERDHEMMPGKLAIHLSFKPLTCLNVLTGWAVAIAEVSVDDVEVSTVLTFVIRNPCLPGAAGDHGISAPKCSMYSGPKVWKISFIEVMVEPLHGMVDDLHGVFGSLLGEVKIEHGSFQAAVAHVSLNNFRMDSGLEKVCCIAMA